MEMEPQAGFPGILMALNSVLLSETNFNALSMIELAIEFVRNPGEKVSPVVRPASLRRDSTPGRA